MSWEYVALGELYEVHNGLSKGGKFFRKGSPFLSFSTVFNKWFLPQELLDLVQSTDNEQQSYSILRGDVFVTRTSETMDELGMSSVALKDYPHATYNGFTKRLRPINPERILPEFIGYYLRTPVFRAGFTAFSTMTTRASLRNEDLLSMKVPVPDMQTQKHIASILSAYDDLVENNQKQIKLLEEAAQRLYKEWFVDLRFPGHETTPIVDGVPEGWEIQTLSQIADVVMGQSPKSEFYNQDRQGLPFHQGVGSYGTRFVIDTTYSTSFTRIAEAGSILFSVRAPVGRLNITKNKIVIGRGLAAINHRSGMQSYLFYLLKERFFKDNIIGNGAIFASISKDELLGQKFIVSVDDLVKRFNTVVSDIDGKIAGLENQIMLLTEARDRLLPKLMSGEIEV
ncbi:MAG: restriction endonuclease subunit S [Clostridiales bacterium]|nr:restriction endonuclease subunit S [Clostridiales bacterium]